MSSTDRRDQVLDAAVVEFGEHGLHGARIETIAKRAGISHPYLVQLFSSKRDLFVAAMDRAFEHMEAAFTDAVQRDDGDPIRALGEAYRRLLRDDPAANRRPGPRRGRLTGCGSCRGHLRTGCERVLRSV